MRLKCLKRLAGCGLAAALLAGCVVGPDYRRPGIVIPPNWQTAPGGFVGKPTLGWSWFADPVLGRLLDAAQTNSPDLQKAAALIDKARAGRGLAGALAAPALGASASAAASGTLNHDGEVKRGASALLDASWELDLFGKARRARESADALLLAREADREGVRTSLAAEVAASYVDYRGCRIRQGYFEDQAASQAKTRDLTRIAMAAGFSSAADAELAEAASANLKASALAQASECEVLVKTLSALSGIAEPALRDLLGAGPLALPQPQGLRITELPAALLRQRPDIVAAERELASASALIGVSEAARWPSFSLTGSVGLASARGSATTSPWAFGPTLNLPIFDGGRIEADVRGARADHRAALAVYQKTVRDAVREVEQALARLHGMAGRESEAEKSALGYRAWLAAVERRWRAGNASLMDLEIARRAVIAAELMLLEPKISRVNYWIALYKAVGGGWNAPQGENQ